VVDAASWIEVESVCRPVAHERCGEFVWHAHKFNGRDRGAQKCSEEADDLLGEDGSAVAMLVLHELDRVGLAVVAAEALRPRCGLVSTLMLARFASDLPRRRCSADKLCELGVGGHLCHGEGTPTKSRRIVKSWRRGGQPGAPSRFLETGVATRCLMVPESGLNHGNQATSTSAAARHAATEDGCGRRGLRRVPPVGRQRAF
jgi:hypothetical protein